jgi:HlyD family secretion protein
MTRKRYSSLIACTLLAAACSPPDGDGRMVGELASDRIELTAESSEPIVEILASEGQAVTAGQVLIRQDPVRGAARLAEAEAALRQVQARLDELVRGPRGELIAAARANVAGAGDELEFRKSDYARIERIHARQLASPELLDQAKAALDAAVANDRLRRAQLQELLSGTTVEELAQAEQAVNQAAARRDLAAVDLERFEIRAPVDGVVDSRLFEVGERPPQSRPVMVLLPGAQPYARIYVPENLRVHAIPGTAAQVHIDGLDGAVPGTVRWVASEATFTPYFALTERDRGRLTYLAKVDIASAGPRLPDGVPVEVQLGTGTQN